MTDSKSAGKTDLMCCPEMPQEPVCDTLRLRYRLPYRIRGQRDSAPVELILVFELKRCSGPLVVGDPIYSTTLMPKEKVRLFTSDRHSRWSFDSESNLSYRHETTSEESFYTAAVSRAMSDLTISESGSVTSSFEESWAEGGGGASLDLGIIEIGGGGGGGSYDASSTSSFARNLSQHAESASGYAASSVRAKSTTAVGEVETRTHSEGESEAHYESSSRMFHNPNCCHAVTYLFRKINKIQKVSFKLVAIQRYMNDSAAPVGVTTRPPLDLSGRVMVIPKSISATSPQRLQIEEMARNSVLQKATSFGKVTASFLTRAVSSTGFSSNIPPIPEDVSKATLAAVDKELTEAGMIDDNGNPTKKIIAELSWEKQEVLPTPGVLVKGCLDECETCEPALEREIELELERKHLKNEKLKREIELLENAKEYRCCPAGEEDTENDDWDDND